MTVLLAVICGFLAARLVWVLLHHLFAQTIFSRLNFRGNLVPTAGGLVIVVALLLVEAGRALAAEGGIGSDVISAPRLATLIAVAAFALLGAIDDLAAHGEARGFRGHLAALAAGRLTTGGLKLVGGGAVAIIVAAVAGGDGGSMLRLTADALLIALAANLANLLDRAPGRLLKASGLVFGVIVVATAAATTLAAAAVVMGAALALFLDDLHERIMLGDTGANPIGAVLAIGVVVTCSPATRTGVLVAVVVANAAAEAVSFTRVIDAVAPLRALDRAGRRR